mmetsp:Transcript_30170/g.85197  ORF Transcript_30170/g.85197 Transcript_30170/m.85197 type:complete len:112 (-) Transcript_30170:5289-5624(-)
MMQQSEVFLLAQVEDDIGEATVRASLEASGVIGKNPGQIPSHHLVFCGTSAGKVSIVRQLEPELHIDSSDKTVEDLKRFLPQLLQIPDLESKGIDAPNVKTAESMLSFFHP